MAEYIEREALMKNFCGYDLTKCVKYGNESAEQQHDSYSTMMMYEIADEIEDAPTANVVSVIRCKDCKHRYSDSWCEYVDDDDNFYCARGERKKVLSDEC